MESFKTNPTIEDSVFCDLFKNPQYAAQFIQLLHPEIKTIHEEDLEIIPLNKNYKPDLFNDLAIMYLDKLVIFVEEQSSYNPNIGLRLFLQAQSILQERVIERTEINMYSHKKIVLPKIEFYCVCTHDQNHSDYETLSNNNEFLQVKVKMLYPNIEEIKNRMNQQ